MTVQQRALTGQVVAITGGARGIGLATARAVVDAGAHVAIGDLDGTEARLAGKELGGFARQLDVADPGAFTAFLDEVEATVGPLDVLVNNAGIMPLGPLTQEPPETTARVLAVNLTAVIHGTREAIRRMTPRGRGHIVNVASLAGRVGVAEAATYCASKHGVVGLSEAVRTELRGTGVEITCVLPTIARTELAAGVTGNRLSGLVSPEMVATAIVDALRWPRFEVYVPGHLGPLNRLAGVLPRPVRDWVGRVSGTDRVLASGTHALERAGYEQRLVRSARDTDGG